MKNKYQRLNDDLKMGFMHFENPYDSEVGSSRAQILSES